MQPEKWLKRSKQLRCKMKIKFPGGVAMKQKIFVIEDDPVIRTELITLLEGNSYEASAATDFSSVIKTVKDVQPHLILLDIKLPQTNGFTLCSQIRSAHHLCDKLHHRHG